MQRWRELLPYTQPHAAPVLSSCWRTGNSPVLAIRLLSGKDLFGETFVDLIRNVILPRRQEFIILMTCSAGTKYENFIHDLTSENQKEFLDALKYLKKKGYPVKPVSEDELHFLLSAYLTACFEPIIHDYDDATVVKYLNTVQEFFMPGWQRIMGLN